LPPDSPEHLVFPDGILGLEFAKMTVKELLVP
jgi:hypothetical protein